jgi:hypothetical protein
VKEIKKIATYRELTKVALIGLAMQKLEQLYLLLVVRMR